MVRTVRMVRMVRSLADRTFQPRSSDSRSTIDSAELDLQRTNALQEALAVEREGEKSGAATGCQSDVIDVWQTFETV